MFVQGIFEIIGVQSFPYVAVKIQNRSSNYQFNYFFPV
jgi:hypothetical protein